MFVVMARTASEAEILGVKSQILAEGMTPFDHQGAERVVIAVVGDVGPRKAELSSRLAGLPGVEQVTPISRPFKLTSREFHPEDTVIRVLDAVIGDGSLTMMAGPCSVESREQLFETADAVAAAGATVLRGGAFKPRTSPYSFQGLGVEALRYLAEARERTGLPVITEVMEPNQVDIVAEYADILQIGTRNMQNYSLLTAVGRVARPVMLKRGYGATVEEWLMAAEYIVSSGQPERHPLRARHPDVRDLHPEHDGPRRGAAPPPPDAPAGDRRSVARDRKALAREAAGDRGRRRRGGRGDGRGPSAAGGGAVRRRAAADPRPVPRPDGGARAGPRARSLAPRRPGPRRGGPRHRRERRERRLRRAGEALIAVSSPDVAVIRQAHRLRGELRLPGDKSISHRALMLATLAAGESRIAGAGDGADVRSTAAVCAALGATVERTVDDETGNAGYRVISPGADGLREPAADLDCGNSGTSLRLFAGILAGLPFRSVLDGDDSLRRRPVARIIEPLRSMGAVLHARSNDSLPPVTVVGRTPLQAVDIATPVPSAQVKSAILLAGLRAEGRTTVREAVATRDHTERMLRARGVPVVTEATGGAGGPVAISLEGGIVR